VRPFVVAPVRGGSPVRGLVRVRGLVMGRVGLVGVRGLVRVRVGLAPGPSSEVGERAATARVRGVRRAPGPGAVPVRVLRVVRMPAGAPGGPGPSGDAVRRSRALVAGPGVLRENVGHPGKRGALVGAGRAVAVPVV
jgi:hypothetical protein